MAPVLWYHPLSSFCWKALVGLYELAVPFEKRFVDLSKESDQKALAALWPMRKFPVLRDDARDLTLAESTTIIEHVDRDGVLVTPEARFRDRFFDLHIHLHMQKLVGDRLRPERSRDPFGVEQARAQMEMAYGIADEWMRAGPWVLGDRFTLGDCSAAPALFYANEVLPFGARRHLAAYLARLIERPSFARVLDEAKPYFAMFPD